MNEISRQIRHEVKQITRGALLYKRPQDEGCRVRGTYLTNVNRQASSTRTKQHQPKVGWMFGQVG